MFLSPSERMRNKHRVEPCMMLRPTIAPITQMVWLKIAVLLHCVRIAVSYQYYRMSFVAATVYIYVTSGELGDEAEREDH